jgi:uncharacterized membrane protein YidH (DUF202 family)
MLEDSPDWADSRVDLARKRTGMAGFRTQLALDRTTLAWIRTTLTMASFGFGMVAFFQSMRQDSPTEETVRLLIATHMGRFSETLTEHVMARRNTGVMENPDLTGHAGTPRRGAFLILFLKVQKGRITAEKFQTYGCGHTIAAALLLKSRS